MTLSKRIVLMVSGALAPVVVVAGWSTSPGPTGEKRPEDVALTGRIVDLHSYMTGKFASSDAVRSTRACLQSGVPAAIETREGLIVIGQGPKGPRAVLARLAHAQVELKGRLYERGGLRYIDMVDAKVIRAADEGSDEERDDAGYMEREPDESEESDTAVEGACCLPQSDCVDTDEDDCIESNGEFYRGASCAEIECNR